MLIGVVGLYVTRRPCWCMQGGAGNGLMSMDFDFASQPGKPEMLLSMDINEDAIVIINAGKGGGMGLGVRGIVYRLRVGCYCLWTSTRMPSL